MRAGTVLVIRACLCACMNLDCKVVNSIMGEKSWEAGGMGGSFLGLLYLEGNFLGWREINCFYTCITEMVGIVEDLIPFPRNENLYQPW